MSSTIKVNNISNLAGDNSGIDLSTNDQIILKTNGTSAVTVNSSQATALGGNLTIPNGGLIGSAGDADAISIATNGVVTFSQTPVGVGGITLKTPVSTGSGTIASFTSLPTGIKRIFVTMRGVSLSGSDHMIVQISTGGTFKTSGYISTSHYGGAGTNNTAGFSVFTGAIQSGHMILQTMGNNVWVENHAFKYNTANCVFGGGDVALGGVIDGVRLKPTGSNAFDLGSVNISYE